MHELWANQLIFITWYSYDHRHFLWSFDIHNIIQIHSNVLWDSHYYVGYSTIPYGIWGIIHGIMSVPQHLVMDLKCSPLEVRSVGCRFSPSVSFIILWNLFRPPFFRFCPLYHMCSQGCKFTQSSSCELGMVNAFVHIVQSHHNASISCGLQFLNNGSLHVPLGCRCPIKKRDHTKSTNLLHHFTKDIGPLFST